MEGSGSIRCSSQRQNQMQWFCQVGALRLQGVFPPPPPSLVPSQHWPYRGVKPPNILWSPKLRYSIGKPLKPFKISKKASHEHLLNRLWKGQARDSGGPDVEHSDPTWGPPLYRCSQSAVPWPEASSPGNPEMQIFGPHPRTTESETLGWAQPYLCFNKS